MCLYGGNRVCYLGLGITLRWVFIIDRVNTIKILCAC